MLKFQECVGTPIAQSQANTKRQINWTGPGDPKDNTRDNAKMCQALDVKAAHPFE